ncbi:MAG TPA: hypothetical protein VF818_00500 [Ktedonobacterales bacterium]
MTMLSAGHPVATPERAATPARRYELDWLRALVVLGLIPFHATTEVAMKGGASGQGSMLALGVGVQLMLLFAMALLFFIADRESARL